MTKKNLLIGIPVAAIALNGLAYLIVSNARSSSRTDSKSDPIAAASGRSTAGAPEGAADDRRRETVGGREGDADREARALARRSAGLAALDAGAYEKALIDFTEARALIGDKANVGDLLRVTEDLRNRQHAPPRAHAAPPPPSPPPRVMARAPVGRRLAIREEMAPARSRRRSPRGQACLVPCRANTQEHARQDVQ